VQSGVDEVVSTNAALPGDFYQNVQSLDMTPDGRFITFVGNTNATSSSSIVVWDAQTATTTTVCPGNKGAVCDSPRIDPTGRYVSFRTTATNVVANSVSPSSKHLYLSDLQAGTTQLVDVTTNGTGSAGEFISNQGMDTAGRYVVFDSTGSDLTSNDSNESADVFVRDTVAGTTVLVSAHHPVLASQTSVPTGISSHYNISADGRYLVFAGEGSGLAPGYTNRYRGIFVRDLVAGTNRLVSVSTNGIGDANGWSTDPIISGNGRYVVFASWANNLVNKDTNAGADVFLSDLQTGTTELVSVDTTNYWGYYYTPNFVPYAISFDGRYIVFTDATEGEGYLRDTTAGVTYDLTTDLFCAAMTPDGHYIAFSGMLPGLIYAAGSPPLYIWDSQAAQLVYTNDLTSAYVYNLAITTNGQSLAYCLSFEPSLHLLNWSSNADQTIATWSQWAHNYRLSFSDDGRYLAYDDQGPNLLGVTNKLQNVFLYDCQTGSNQLVSTRYYSPNGADGNSSRPSISADGRFVVYESTADDLVPGTTEHKQVYLFDRVTGATTLLSYSPFNAAPGNFISEAPVFTGDGQTVVFQSFASDLVTNDFNGGGDLFVVQLSATNTVGTATNSSLVQVSQLVYSSGAAGLAGSGPTLAWPATSGASYQVWYKDNFSDPAWQPLKGSITIQGQQAQAVDFTPNTSHRFYKIVGN
jgi:hypothetical protein